MSLTEVQSKVNALREEATATGADGADGPCCATISDDDDEGNLVGAAASYTELLACKPPSVPDKKQQKTKKAAPLGKTRSEELAEAASVAQSETASVPSTNSPEGLPVSATHGQGCAQPQFHETERFGGGLGVFLVQESSERGSVAHRAAPMFCWLKVCQS